VAEPPACLRPATPPTAWGPPEPEPPPEDLAGPDPSENLTTGKQQVADLVHATAPHYGVDPRLALAVIAVESNFDATAVSPKDARGLMQLIPETAARYNVRDPFNAKQNLHGGLAYLRFLLAYYRGQVTLAAAAYNAGEKAVDRHRGIPPYPETQAYVQRVLALYRRAVHPYDPRHAGPSPIVPVTEALGTLGATLR
jgi:soluble lytic murein transglycosylase-like protein